MIDQATRMGAMPDPNGATGRPWPRMEAVGRAGLASLFLLGAANKIATFGATVERMEAAGLPVSALLLPAVIALEAAGGLLVARGGRAAWPAALALAAFTLATNGVFHRFWEMSGPIAQLELSLFFKNVAIAGALLMVAGREGAR